MIALVGFVIRLIALVGFVRRLSRWDS